MKLHQTKTQQAYYDLTLQISENTVVFPGDPSFKCQKICTIQKGEPFTLCHMQMGNHMGTHIDFPIHIIKQGKTSSDYNLNDLIGTGIIINVPDSLKSITKQFISQFPLQKYEIIFFKTLNSKLSVHESFFKDYVFIEHEAAEELVKNKVKIVGIDYLSVDKLQNEDLPVHKILLSNGVLIVEGLNLRQAPEGPGQIYIAPLKISNIDGAPCRVFMKKI